MPGDRHEGRAHEHHGKIQVKLAACTASTCFNDSPMQAEIHENVNPTARTSAYMTIALRNPFLKLNPTR